MKTACISTNPLNIYIGWDSREAECADVLSHSILRRASIPVEIHYLKIQDLNFFKRPTDPLQSTEFTYSRFLVPYLQHYEGIALFLDCDMVCLSDIAEIAALPMDDIALRVRKHDHRPVETVKMDDQIQTAYPRKNWSSMMLMNCGKLRIWTRWIVENASGAYLHQFKGISNLDVGDLPEGWNDLDRLQTNTKLLHYTSGGPWFDNYRDHPNAGIWLSERQHMLNNAK